MARYTPAKPDPDAIWIRVPEAMWIGRVSQSWIYLRIKSGEIESKLAGRYRIIRRDSFERYVDRLPTKRTNQATSKAA